MDFRSNVDIRQNIVRDNLNDICHNYQYSYLIFLCLYCSNYKINNVSCMIYLKTNMAEEKTKEENFQKGKPFIYYYTQ